MNHYPARPKKYLYKLTAVAVCIIMAAASTQAQDMNTDVELREVNPRTALLKSFVVPGWGHHYVDRQNWRRGQYHLAAEVVLIASYLGFRSHSRILEQNMFTLAAVHSGSDIKDRDRTFQLAVGNFDSLDDFNDFQERSRNLDRLLPNTPEYHWEWDSRESRAEYRDLRGRWDQTNQQMPAMMALMVVNRVFSGLSAFTQARSHNANLPEVSLSYNPYFQSGIQANISVHW